jgi:hypothetical protein
MPQPTSLFRSAGTDRTPEIVLDPEAGLLTITGCSIPENPERTFAPLHAALDHYEKAPAKRTVVRIHLTYFNSSSTKYLLDLLKRLEDLHVGGTSEVLLEWCHEKGDLDMQEAGNDYKQLLEFPTQLVEVRSE